MSPGRTVEYRMKYRSEICNRIHTEPNGIVISPAYPDVYPPNMDCLIKIQLEDVGLKLAIFFSKFELENSQNCNSDYVQIDNGPKNCGKFPPQPFFKNSNSADIRFRSNDVLSGKSLGKILVKSREKINRE